MDILLKHWLPILGLLLPSLLSAVLFLVLKRKGDGPSRAKGIVCGILSVASILSGTALGVFVLSVGGGIDLVLPLLLLPLLMMLL